MFFNCGTLDNIANKRTPVKVETFVDGKLERVTYFSSKEHAQRVAGIAYRKLVNGEKIRIRTKHDPELGRVIVGASYGNGTYERFTY